VRTRPLAALALALLAAGLPGCTPGIQIEVFNRSAEEAAVTSVFNDGKTATRALAPGESLVAGPAVSWHVRAAGLRSELVHPGEDFRARAWLSMGVFRFQIEPSGCIFALAPDATPPVASLPAQPPGYPIGPAGRCAAP
jgi:hypothetical protein